MSGEHQRILEMLAAGKLAPAEAERLLAALRRPRPRLDRWLFQPLELLPTHIALLVGVAAAAAGLLLSLLRIRFDGALDLHLVDAQVPWSVALVDHFLAWPATALVLWGAARLVARQGRFVDFLAAVGVARVPLVLAAALVGGVGARFDQVDEGAVPPAVVVVALLTLPFVAWFVALLVTGMRTAAGLRGARLAAAAVGGVVAAEILTKLALLAI